MNCKSLIYHFKIKQAKIIFNCFIPPQRELSWPKILGQGKRMLYYGGLLLLLPYDTGIIRHYGNTVLYILLVTDFEFNLAFVFAPALYQNM